MSHHCFVVLATLLVSSTTVGAFSVSPRHHGSVLRVSKSIGTNYAALPSWCVPTMKTTRHMSSDDNGGGEEGESQAKEDTVVSVDSSSEEEEKVTSSSVLSSMEVVESSSSQRLQTAAQERRDSLPDFRYILWGLFAVGGIAGIGGIGGIATTLMKEGSTPEQLTTQIGVTVVGAIVFFLEYQIRGKKKDDADN
eukprot:scaffold1206_cov56-Attheya_sp.AAC.3